MLSQRWNPYFNTQMTKILLHTLAESISLIRRHVDSHVERIGDNVDLIGIS